MRKSDYQDSPPLGVVLVLFKLTNKVVSNAMGSLAVHSLTSLIHPTSSIHIAHGALKSFVSSQMLLVKGHLVLQMSKCHHRQEVSNLKD